MGYFGSLVGEGLGKIGGSLVGGALGDRGAGESLGSKLGSRLGSYLPFKKGGFTTMPVVPKKLRKGGMADMDGYKKGGVVPNHVPLPMNYMSHVISPPQRFYGNRAQL